MKFLSSATLTFCRRRHRLGLTTDKKTHFVASLGLFEYFLFVLLNISGANFVLMLFLSYRRLYPHDADAIRVLRKFGHLQKLG